MKRNLFDDLVEGFEALAAEREGKLTLKTHVVEPEPIRIDADELVAIRKQLNMSQGVFARVFHVKPRTYQNWERGQGAPSQQAAILFKLVKARPEMIKDIEALS
ncbi:MAG: transcriptional regulator [Alcanivorax sp.]|nr:transcriptional regulator [Alcanivorax sp.]